MSKSSPARARRKIADKALAPANQNVPKNLDNMTPDELKHSIIQMSATIQVMENEATLANRMITQLRSERLVNQSIIQELQKQLAKAQPKPPKK
jgi:hypothetical protein